MALIEFDKKSIEKRLTSAGRSVLNDIARSLGDARFPVGKEFPYCGETTSIVKSKKFWIEENDNGDFTLLSNLVPDKPTHMYIKDLINVDFLEGVKNAANNAFVRWESMKEANEWVENGKPCVYRYGWAYRGAGARRISPDKAKELLPKYSFGKGFYELSWLTIDGEKVLEFNELSENDMW